MLKNTTDNPVQEDGEFIDEVGHTIDPSDRKPLEVTEVVINSTTSPGSAIKPLKVKTINLTPKD